MLNPFTASACAAAGTALVGTFAIMDCSPSLYLANLWWQRRRTMQAPQRIWIIGASDGIGRELAIQLAKNHEAKELILSSRSMDKMVDIKSEIASFHRCTCEVSILPMDVCETSSIDAAFQTLTQEKRTIDTVVFNAGAGTLELVEEPSDVEQTMQVNAIWPMTVAPRLLRDSRLFPTPHFVVTASVASVMPVPLSAAYAAAKHALLGYFRSLQAELPSCRIHTFLPGPIDTNFHKSKGGSTKLKQGKERCAELMRTGMKLDRSKEFFIARQPLLFLLYLNQMFPSLLMSLVYRRVGPKRRSLWKQGLDLYDPKSWRS